MFFFLYLESSAFPYAALLPAGLPRAMDAWVAQASVSVLGVVRQEGEGNSRRWWLKLESNSLYPSSTTYQLWNAYKLFNLSGPWFLPIKWGKEFILFLKNIYFE